LAVDDIKAVQEQAALKRMAMQVNRKNILFDWLLFSVMYKCSPLEKDRELSWSYGSWICNYLCSRCLSPLTLWVQIPLMARCTWYIIMW